MSDLEFYYLNNLTLTSLTNITLALMSETKIYWALLSINLSIECCESIFIFLVFIVLLTLCHIEILFAYLVFSLLFWKLTKLSC